MIIFNGNTGTYILEYRGQFIEEYTYSSDAMSALRRLIDHHGGL